MNTLDVQRLLREARRQTGLEDFCGDAFVPALEALVNSLNQDGNLNALGTQLQYDRLLDLLQTRLRFGAYLARYPEILEETLAPPVVILGLPRTGTTMLQRLLSTDTRFIGTRWYEVRFPVPALDWDFKDANDERISVAKAEVAALIEANPDLLSIHPLDATAPDEDLLLLETTFLSAVPGSQADIPSYNAFYEADDALAATAFHKQLLQFLQWQRSRAGHDVDGKPWLLKTPAHMHTIQAMLATYPGAKFITSHRNPLACIPSISSFYDATWKIYSDHADPRRCGAYTSHFFSAGLNRVRAAAEQEPERFLDIEYEDLVGQQEQTLERIYEFIGWPITGEAQTGFDTWRSENRRDKRKPHHYSLAAYGLDEAELQKTFADYGREHGYF